MAEEKQIRGPRKMLDPAPPVALVTNEELTTFEEVAADDGEDEAFKILQIRGSERFASRCVAEVRRLQSLVTGGTGFAAAVEWLRERAALEEAEIDDECDGVDADRFCATAANLRKMANELEQWAKGLNKRSDR